MDEQEHRRWSHWPDRVMAIVAAAALVVSIVGTWWQLKLTRESLELAEFPWVTTKVLPVIDADVGNSNVTLKLKNTGDGPALKLKITSEIAVPLHADVDETEAELADKLRDLTPGTDDYSVGLLGPDEDVEQEVKFLLQDGAPIDTSRAIATGWRDLVVAGRADYRDVFGNHHWVTYCMRYAFQTHAFVMCRTGNDAGMEK
jgi:hypothetical protein